MQPLTGIQAYYINSKPVYSDFLSAVTAQGGNSGAFPSIDSIQDGYFATTPWVGVVVQKNASYAGGQAQYTNLILSDPTGKQYPLSLNSADYFSAAVTGYWGNAPSPTTQDYFGVLAPKASGTYSVTLTYRDIPYSANFLVPVAMPAGATKWSDIILNYGELFTEDNREQEKFDINPASFLNEKAYYLAAAIPRFNQPPPIECFLAQNTSAFYTEYFWTVPGEVPPEGETPTSTTEPTVVSTGLYGYGLCSVVARGVDQFGNPEDTPYLEAQYNPATGEVTFEAGLIPGTQYVICLYLDGFFSNTLTPEMKRILGLCFHLVWEYRFTSAYLPRAAKINDKSFIAPNEANWTRAQEEKRRSLEDSLNQELKKYSQNCAYRGTVGAKGNFSFV